MGKLPTTFKASKPTKPTIAKSTPAAAQRWTTEEDAQLISMRRQGIPFIDIAKALDKTERAVSQKYLKLCPPTNSTKKKNADVQMTELQKVRLLAVVSRRKGGWWNEVATEIEGGFTGAQCEVMWNQITRG